MNVTNIDTADITINGVVGCDHNCAYCYAREQAKRQKRRCIQCYYFKPHQHLARLKQLTPRQKPKMIFLDSMWDWNCQKNKLWWLYYNLVAIKRCPQHTFQILSKRPKFYSRIKFPKNVWLGTSVESWREQWRINDLIFKAGNNNNLKFLSIEPIKDELRYWIGDKIDWVIIGAETGRRKDKTIPNSKWIARILDNCQMENIPVFMKDSLESHYDGGLIQQFPNGRKIT